MSKKEIIQQHRDEIFNVARKYGVTSIKLFGSVARGEDADSSDVDFLVDMEPGRSLFDLGGFQIELQEIFHCKVDVVTEKGLHWFIRDRIQKEAMAI
ncbi:MAG: nucleotidyltransferase family protein [Verrucomicrobiae bacterium]|nr:nucleotidyltransferase family protein [Verrucomicrobiae bacterium]